MALWMVNRKDRKTPIEMSAFSASEALKVISKYYENPVTDYSVFSFCFVDPKRMNRKIPKNLNKFL